MFPGSERSCYFGGPGGHEPFFDALPTRRRDKGIGGGGDRRRLLMGECCHGDSD
jgi:hypothetical protein